MGLAEATEPQRLAIPRILKGEDVLLIAPTGLGKTEAALLPVLDGMLRRKRREGISALYVTPLRALNRDMVGRLKRWADLLEFRVEVRHGDTPTRERRRQALKPPDLLVTTPETLQAILPGSRMQKHLTSVRWVIVDEVHELAADRRGVQLTVGLERLAQLTPQGFQRIGLSATVGNPAEVAAFLGGASGPVGVLNSRVPKAYSYLVEFPTPVPDDHETARRLYISPEAAAALNRLEEWVDTHEQVLIFVNSRGSAEILSSRFAMMRKDVGVHHGSLPREERARVEASFKAGGLRALVATSTLELGIDVGRVDLVLQYMSPRRVTSLIQRVGRSGHGVGRQSRGVTIATSPEDALEAIAVTLGARGGELEPLAIHRGALDVLAHQVLGLALDRGGRVAMGEALAIVHRAWPYHDLDPAAFQRVVTLLQDLKLLRREEETLVVGRRGRDHYFVNLSMIRDERRYPAIDLTTQQAVGILGEEFMMIRARQGVNFLVKGKPWKIQRIAPDGRVYVTPVDDPTAALPGWDGEMLPVTFDLAQRVAGLRRRVGEALAKLPPEAVVADLKADWPANAHALAQIVTQTAAHLATGAALPTEEVVLVEAFDRYLILHMPFGEVVNETLGDFIEDELAKDHLVRFWWADAQHVLLELTVPTSELDVEGVVSKAIRVGPEEVEKRLRTILEEHFPLGFHMKFIAERFGALPRGTMVGADEMNALQLRFKGTPIEEEALREAHLLHLDFHHVRQVVEALRTGEMRLAFHRSLDRPTPLGYPILQRFVEAPELFAPDAASDANLDRMRDHLTMELVSLLCMQCGQTVVDGVVKDLGDRPACPACGGSLLGILPFSHAHLLNAFERRRRREKLEPEELKALARLRQSADLVLSYGQMAIVAQLVYGIGPQTAAKILAKMHDEERDFYRDLLEAKLRFITNRQYWDR